VGHGRLYIVDDFLIEWEGDNIVRLVGASYWLDLRNIQSCDATYHIEVQEVAKYHKLRFGEKQ